MSERPLHGWDPRLLGAACDRCPLGPRGFLREAGKPWAPVPGEDHARDGATTLAIAECPADDETAKGYPFAGKSGVEWTDCLRAVGKARTAVSIENVIACQPPGQPGGAYERMAKALKTENDRRAEARAAAGASEDDPAYAPWPSPAECCRPRLHGVVARYRDVIPLGGTAAKAVLGTEQGIFAIRGGPRELPAADGSTRRVLPTFHPAFVLRATQWREVLQADLAKAFRWFENRRNWSEPETRWRPSPEELHAWLAEPSPFGFETYDYETDGIEPLTARVRCIGFGKLVHPFEAHCGFCMGTGRRVTEPNGEGGSRPVRPEERALPCGVCNGRGVRTIDARALLVPILSVDGQTRFYSEAEEEQIKGIIRAYMVDPTRLKVGHNAGSYDRIVSEQWLRVTPAPLLDTLFPARMRAPDLPKNLGVVGGILTDVHTWKNDAEGNKIAYGAQSDGQLHYYCSLDCVVNARIVPPLMEAVDRVGGRRPIADVIRPKSWPSGRPWTLLAADHQAQEMCVGMHYVGAYIDQEKRASHEVKLAKEALKWKGIAMRYAHEIGVTGKVHVAARTGEVRRVELFNPGSNDQLAEVLFEQWGIVPKVFTEGGDASVADEVIREILTSEGLPPERFSFLDAVRRFKRAVKARSTFIVPGRLRSEDPEHGLAWPDGRIRSSWSAHTTSVGRLSCSGNNQQNVPAKYRDMYAAAPGHVLIGGDVDQFHLRIIANRWGIGRLLDAFDKGIDPHSALAYDFFGAAFANASGWGPAGFSLLTKDKPKKDSDADKMRQVAKIIRYRGAYWDTPEGIHQSVIKTEDGDGNLPFAHFSLREVHRNYKIWMRAEPEWERAWQWCMDQYQRNGGWLETGILGRRSGSLENGKKEAIVNFDILPVETDIMRLIECEVMAAFPFFGEGPGTGMTNECHDSIEIERVGQCWEEPAGRSHQGPDVYWRPAGKDRILCWTRKVEWDRAKLEECMNVQIPGWPVRITSEAKAGRNWKEA